MRNNTMATNLQRFTLYHGRSMVARWPVLHRPGRYFIAHLAEAGNMPVF